MAIGVAARYLCGDEERRAALETSIGNGVVINGIDYIEVIDRDLVDTPAESARQQILLVHCFAAGIDGLTADHIRIDGGVRITPIGIEWVRVLSDILDPSVPILERNFLQNYRPELQRDRVLAVGTDSNGDFSTYSLSLVDPGTTNAAAGFDPRLSRVDFSFKVECPSEFDCVEPPCPPQEFSEPAIDYLAKDYSSFRRLMLDRMSAIAPEWQERNPADLGVALVEMLAYVGDQLSYYQDAVSTEAYLGTARQRVSVRRHARLVDYFIGEGVNARTWAHIEIPIALDGVTIATGTRLLTKLPGKGVVLSADDARVAAANQLAATFETMHEVRLWEQLNEIEFYTWSDRECCLPVGATKATLVGPLPEPQFCVGDHILFEEVIGPKTGQPVDADPRHRHVVRITKIERGEDPLVENLGDPPIEVVEIEWDAADALPFALCISSITAEGQNFVPMASVARGNLVLCDHGRTIPEAGADPEQLPPVPEEPRWYRPTLQNGPVTHAAPLPDKYFDGRCDPDYQRRPATELFRYQPADASPAIELVSNAGIPWKPARDLLASDGFAEEFVAEIENDGQARIRFGDGKNGKLPAEATRFDATYRVGNGVAGNIGHDALGHIVDGPAGITAVRNPLAATGGTEPEKAEEVRRYAPEAFRVQQRAVTEDDYARVTERHPEVQRAAATFRWTGSWHTVFITVDRRGGLAVDADFQQRIRRHVNLFRMAGHDLEIDRPRFVSLDIKLIICVASGYFRSHVKQALLDVFSNRRLAGGELGFFHADNWTFAQPVYLSRIYAAAEAVTGVDSVVVEHFQRRASAPQGEIESGEFTIGRLEIAQLDNDPSRRENGSLELEMTGGL